MKKKTESPYTMRTVQRSKVQGIKILLKKCVTKPVFKTQPQEYRVLFWLVTNSAKFKRKLADSNSAFMCFNNLIEFEKHQTVISI